MMIYHIVSTWVCWAKGMPLGSLTPLGPSLQLENSGEGQGQHCGHHPLFYSRESHGLRKQVWDLPRKNHLHTPLEATHITHGTITGYMPCSPVISVELVRADLPRDVHVNEKQGLHILARSGGVHGEERTLLNILRCPIARALEGDYGSLGLSIACWAGQTTGRRGVECIINLLLVVWYNPPTLRSPIMSWRTACWGQTG